jgi:Protein of unknown function (DUF2889)
MSQVIESNPHLAELPPTLDDSQTGTPARRAGSVRRTSTIDMIWPGGFGTPLELDGHGRDLLTPEDGEPSVLDEASIRVELAQPRTVTAISVTPASAGIEDLIGAVGGSALRSAIDDVVPRERDAATPLHLLLDDIAGTSLVAGFAWSRARPDAFAAMSRQGNPQFGVRKGRIICSGLRPDGWAQTHASAGAPAGHAIVPAGSLERERDPIGWHDFPEDPTVGMRRHRRIDVWRDGDALEIDSFFRDAAWEPDGSQMALHEYTVRALVDATTHTLREIEATPRVLPFPECQWAAPNTKQLAGRLVTAFRTDVQTTLTELRACTHLNDMLRCLAEVPSLAARI